ncbi:MAG: hypothetical protein GY853_13740 [PVC group bacterium]|nr:hypothetical protein [PVC group bacterium]
MDTELIKKYKKLLGDYIEIRDDHSIYNSEMYLFWKFAQDYDVKRVLESGTYMGSSIARLKRLFPDAEMITYESDPAHYKRCKKIKGVKYVFGELKNNLKKINKNTALLIDGPKRKLASRLARQALKKGALFVGMHDMYEYIDYLGTKFRIVVHSGYPTAAVKKLDNFNIATHKFKDYYGTVLAVVRN